MKYTQQTVAKGEIRARVALLYIFNEGCINEIHIELVSREKSDFPAANESGTAAVMCALADSRSSQRSCIYTLYLYIPSPIASAREIGEKISGKRG